jgi:hypothetical protein
MQKIIGSTETNTKVIQSLYRGFASGNIKGVADLLTSDFIMHVLGKGRVIRYGPRVPVPLEGLK